MRLRLPNSTMYFFDTEFIEDGSTIDLVSIGVVSLDGREYSACSTDAQLHRAGPWVRRHVMPLLPPYGEDPWKPRVTIAAELREFIRPSAGAPPMIWSYYADYDWVALCQLFGTMMALPAHFPKYCMDLKQLSMMLGDQQNRHPEEPWCAHDALTDARWNRDLFDVLVGGRDGDSDCDVRRYADG